VVFHASLDFYYSVLLKPSDSFVMIKRVILFNSTEIYTSFNPTYHLASLKRERSINLGLSLRFT
jgi:hypothetical protein